MIGKLADTDVVDLAIKNTSSEIRETKAIYKKYKEQLAEIKVEMGELRDIPKMEKDLAKLEKDLKRADELSKTKDRIEHLVIMLSQLNQRKESSARLVAAEDEINAVLNDIERLIAKFDEARRLSTTYDLLIKERARKERLQVIINKASVEEIDSVIKQLDNALSAIRTLNAISVASKKLIAAKQTKQELEKYMVDPAVIEEVISDLEVCQRKLVEIDKLKEANDKLERERSRKRTGINVITNMENDYKNKVNAYINALRERKICDMCGSEITDERIDRIAEMF